MSLFHYNTKGLLSATHEEWKRMRIEWEKKHPALHVINEIWDFFYYPISRSWDFISSIPREIKWWFQRANRGWSQCDAWSIHYHNSKVTKEMLIHYRDNGHVSIISPNVVDREPTNEEWVKAEKDTFIILNKMIDAFTEAVKIGVGDIEVYHEIWWSEAQKDFRLRMEKEHGCIHQTKEQYEKMQAGFKLFYEHYFSLWD